MIVCVRCKSEEVTIIIQHLVTQHFTEMHGLLYRHADAEEATIAQRGIRIKCGDCGWAFRPRGKGRIAINQKLPAWLTYTLPIDHTTGEIPPVCGECGQYMAQCEAGWECTAEPCPLRGNPISEERADHLRGYRKG